MLNRRLIFLFICFALAFCALTLRLIKLQVFDAADKRDIIRNFVHRTHPLDTFRGSILDRNGLPLAQDTPSDELAIDYRAMNLDEKWLTQTATARLISSGEWDALPDSGARRARREELKADLASKIEAIPDAIAQVCQIPKDDVLNRFQEIRARIHALRQDFWSRRFNRESRLASTQPSQSSVSQWIDSLWGRTEIDDEKALDSAFNGTQLQEEVLAHTIRSNIPAPVANYFRQHADDFPGLIIRDKSNRRDYPFGPATAHLTGALGPLSQEALAANPFKYPDLLNNDDLGNLGGYLPGDRTGETGAEKLLDSLLRGTPGARLINLTDQGDETALADSPHIDPIPGQNVRLTIDAAFQRDLYLALTDPSKSHGEPGKSLLRGDDGKDHFIGLVVLSLDGQILAMLSLPTYDPNTIDDTRLTLNADTFRRPLLSRAFRETYRPGSTIKPLLAAAGLTESVITPDTIFNCTGHFFPSRTDIFKCLETHSEVSLDRAIAESCNVYFFNVADRLGIDRLARWYSAYGFGADTGMELTEAKGHLPTATSQDPESIRADTLFLGIGQGPIDVTPLQMANAYATLLRRGTAVAPRLLVDTPPHSAKLFDISPATLASVREGMEHVVSKGTARTVFKNFPLKVAGKTGTAETVRPAFDDEGIPIDDPAKPLLHPDRSPILRPDGSPAFRQRADKTTDAWFVGYAPADNPKFVIAAVMESGGHGGRTAAPMVREALTLLQKHNYLPQE